MKARPKAGDNLLGVEINVVDKGEAVMAEFGQSLVAIQLRDLFAQPLPETFNRIEVGTVARERENLETELLGISANLASAMIGSAIPNEDDLTTGFAQPKRELVEEVQGGIAIAFAILPEETGAIGKVVSTKVVEASRETGRSAGHPVRFTHRRPGKADFQVLVQMDFIDIDDNHFATAHPFIKRLKLLDKVGSFCRIGLAQQLLALFPTQPGRSENRAQGVAADFPSQLVSYPALQLLECPATPGQSMLVGSAGFDDGYDFCFYRLAKKGGQPPLCR